METPPDLPAPKPPLGARFYILLLTPLALIGLTFCCANVPNLGSQLLVVAGLATLVCSILLAIQLARRLSKTGTPTIGMSIALFFAVQGFYGVCFFIGCTAAVAFS